MTELTDEEIAKQVQNGNAQAFGLLVERYEEKLKRYARRFLLFDDAGDVLQEIFLKAYANLKGFDPSRNFSPWIYRIAHNEFINFIKKRGKEPVPFFDPDTIFPHPVAKDNPVRELQNSEAKVMMEKALSELNPKYREPLILYFFEDMPYEKISEILQIPISTVGVRLNRGKLALKNIYYKMYGTNQ